MILVTGASGCLGANLTRALATAGERVAALVLPGDPAPALAGLGRTLDRRTGDVLDPASLRAAFDGVTHLYHAAGIASPRPADEARMWAVNVDGTRHVLAAAASAGVARVVHVSSIAAVAYPDGMADEASAYNGAAFRFPYMHSKHAAEQVVREQAAHGLDVVSVCPAAVIAPYCDLQQGWGRILQDVAARRLAFCPPGGIAYLGGADLVAGLRAAMRHGRSGERYILASGNTSYRALLDCFAAAAGVTPPRWTAPRPLLRAGAFALRLLEPWTRRLWPQARVSSGVLNLLWRRKHYRIARAAEELKFVPAQSLGDAVADTWAWLAALPDASRHGA